MTEKNINGEREIPLEIERKFVIKIPDLTALSKMSGYTVSHITQTYLKAAPHVTHRVRKREYSDAVIYTETKKLRIDRLSSFEDEREIREEKYLALLKDADDSAHTLTKVRHTLPFNGLVLEIDVYPEWKNTCIMEIELPDRYCELALPSFIAVVREVTGEKRYSNASMAVSFPTELD